MYFFLCKDKLKCFLGEIAYIRLELWHLNPTFQISSRYEIRLFNELWQSAEKHIISRCAEQLLGELGASPSGARCCAPALWKSQWGKCRLYQN